MVLIEPYINNRRWEADIKIAFLELDNKPRGKDEICQSSVSKKKSQLKKM